MAQVRPVMTRFIYAIKIEIYFEQRESRFQDVFSSKYQSLFYKFRFVLRELVGLVELVVSHGQFYDQPPQQQRVWRR